MGKHERELIKEAENIIVNLLAGEPNFCSPRDNKWYSNALAVAKRIKRDFGMIKSAKHIGNRYDLIGDIIINDGNKNFFIEVKMSEKALGRGTKANISQDALTELNLFDGKVKSWSEFRKEHCHEKLIFKSLLAYKKYPYPVCKKIKFSNKLKEDLARYIRENRKTDDEAERVIRAIHDIDKKIKLKYLSYLSKLPQNEDNIKKFYILIMLGVHKVKEMKKLMEDPNLVNQSTNLLVYYGNKVGEKVIVKKEDVGKKIKKFLDKIETFKILFKEGETNCKLVGVSCEGNIPLLNIVLHWKNIAQGIKTPCLNIFDITPTKFL